MVFTDKGFDCFVFFQLDVFQSVRSNEAVFTDHNRQTHVRSLTDPVGLQIVVIGLLVVFSVDLDKTGITLCHGVGIIMVDIDGAGQGTAGNGQNDGQPGGSRAVEDLIHVGKARGGSRRDGPAAGGFGADTG